MPSLVPTPRRSSARRYRPSGIGSYTATSSRPFNRRFFEDLDRRLATSPSPANPALTVRLGHLPPFPPATRA